MKSSPVPKQWAARSLAALFGPVLAVLLPSAPTAEGDLSLPAAGAGPLMLAGWVSSLSSSSDCAGEQVTPETTSSGSYGSMMTLGEGAGQLFYPIWGRAGCCDVRLETGSCPGVAEGWDGVATLLPPRSVSARCSQLSPLFQGPAEQRWQRWSPSDGRMVVLRQFGLLLWKNYILQVGWHRARGGC